jgi:hypothetical protein
MGSQSAFVIRIRNPHPQSASAIRIRNPHPHPQSASAIHNPHPQSASEIRTPQSATRKVYHALYMYVKKNI